MTCHPIYPHPFTNGAMVSPIEWCILVEAAYYEGELGVEEINKAIGESRALMVRTVYYPN
jgi:hypothetical protein